MRRRWSALVLDGGVPVLVDTSPALRWIGSGRTVFDNKGNAIKQYEPYFSSIPDYEDEAELVEQGVTPLMHYDPLGRIVRTELPNGTESRVEFDGWTQVTYDANDLVEGSEWYESRIGYAGVDVGLLAEKTAASQAYAHRDTPTTTNLDSQGRSFRVSQHNIDTVTNSAVFNVTKSVFDVQGNVLDVLYYVNVNVERSAQQTEYGMLGQPLKTLSTDAGNRVMLASVLGEPIRAWNDRGFITRPVYDVARRPTQQWVKPGAGAEQLVVFNVYGEQIDDPEDNNLRGQLYRSYDGAGALTAESFDFKGDLLRQSRRMAADYKVTPDWGDLATEATLVNIEAAAAAWLESETFATETTYDAFGRVKTQTAPDNSETAYTYDEGGGLQAVECKLRGSATATEFVEQIEYDAKGQRLRVELGNGTTTVYTYDPRTYRVTRIRTDRASDSAVMQDLKYTYDPVGNITAIRDDAQQTVYFSNAVVSPTQTYVYDAVYRLVEAKGRETPNGQPQHEQLVPSPSPPPNDGSAVIPYTEAYSYDEVGNILKVVHLAGVNSWTRHYEYAADSNRLLATSMPGDLDEGPYTGTIDYDDHGNMVSMLHLPGGIAWDHADRMQATNHGGGGITYYVYDGAGERVRKVRENMAGSTSKERLYFGGWETYRERHNIDTTPVLDLERETLYIDDDGGRICLVETKAIEGGAPVVSPASIARYQYANHLGSAALELTGDGEIISYEEFHPYGSISYSAVDASVDVSPKRYRYTGMERDEETGLAYHGARYYAPWLARWTACDPIGLGDGPNRFAYAGGNPIVSHDTTGTAQQPFQAGQTINKSQFNDTVNNKASLADDTIALLLPGSGGEHLVVPTSSVQYDKSVRGVEENHTGVKFRSSTQGQSWHKEFVLAAQGAVMRRQTELGAQRILASNKLIGAAAVIGVTGGLTSGLGLMAAGTTSVFRMVGMGALSGAGHGASSGAGLALVDGGGMSDALSAAANGAYYGAITGGAMGLGGNILGRIISPPTRTFVGDSGLFMSRVPGNGRSIGDLVLADPANRILVTPQVLRQTLLPKNVFARSAKGVKARTSAVAQARRLFGAEARVDLTLTGGFRAPKALLRKTFDATDLTMLKAASRKKLSVVSTDTKLQGQAKSIDGVAEFLDNTIPEVLKLGQKEFAASWMKAFFK